MHKEKLLIAHKEKKGDVLLIKYEDVTQEMIKNKNLNPIEPREVFKYHKKNLDGSITTYDISNSKFDSKKPDKEEISSIKRLRDIFGFNIEILHRVNEDKVSTPDIRNILEDLEYWDIKGIHKSETLNSKNNKISHAIRESKKQTPNVVIDLNRSDCDLSNNEAIEQLFRVFNNEYYDWIEKIIIFGKDDLVKYYKRK